MKLSVKHALFIATIFLIGFFLRSQETISGNFLFLLDSGRDMMDVKNIVFDHKLTLIGPYTSLGGVFQGPLYYYLLAIPTAIFKGDPWGNILLMLIISLSVMLIVFLGMKTYFGIVPAAIAFALFAFSPEAIAAATYFWNPHPMWFIIVAYIFLLFGTISYDTRLQLGLWPVIALSFHFQMAFGVFLFIATSVYMLLFHRDLLKKGNYFWSGLVLGSVLFIPQILFELRHDFLMTRSVIEIFLGNSRGLITGGEKGDVYSVLINNIYTLKNNFISSFIHEKQFSFIPGLMLLLSAVGFIYAQAKNKFTKHEKLFARMIFAIIIIIYTLSLVYPFPMRYWFLTGFQSFYLILGGLLISKIFFLRAGKILLYGLLLLTLLHSAFRLQTLYGSPPDDGGHAKIKGKLHAIDYIYRDAGNSKFNIMIFTPPVLTDAYDYLFWWYGNRTYGYVPGQSKTGVVYLLIEPDPEKPWSYNGWLETVVKTGVIESTITMPSGIIIQKRFM